MSVEIFKRNFLAEEGTRQGGLNGMYDQRDVAA